MCIKRHLMRYMVVFLRLQIYGTLCQLFQGIDFWACFLLGTHMNELASISYLPMELSMYTLQWRIWRYIFATEVESITLATFLHEHFKGLHNSNLTVFYFSYFFLMGLYFVSDSEPIYSFDCRRICVFTNLIILFLFR